MKKRGKCRLYSLFVIFGTLLFAILLLNGVYAIGSLNYNISNPTISSGADNSSSATYKNSLIIEDVSANITSSLFKNFLGFFYTSSGNVSEDVTPPIFINLRNFTHTVNTSFSSSISATDDSGISNYWLNDTSVFNISSSGLITNITNLSTIKIYWLNITVTDNSAYKNNVSGVFYVNVTADTISPNVTINLPTASTYSSASITFSATISELGYCEYSLNAGVTNITMNTLDNLTFYNTSSLANGVYTVNFYCNDTSGNRNDTMNVSFVVSVSTTTAKTGGGGGGGITSRSLGELIVEDKLIDLSMVIDSASTRLIRIRNNGTGIISVGVKVQELEKMIILENNDISFKLAPGERRELQIRIVAPHKPGIYTGKVIINGQDALITLNVNTKQLLFDVGILIPNNFKVIDPGTDLESQVTLIPMGKKPILDVTLNYVIKNFNGKIFLTESETMLIESQKTFKKYFSTNLIPSGDYILGLELVYPTGVATSSSHFKINPVKSLNFKTFLILFLIAIAILIILILFIYRNKKRTKDVKDFRRIGGS